jgi:hypothetical protein
VINGLLGIVLHRAVAVGGAPRLSAGSHAASLLENESVPIGFAFASDESLAAYIRYALGQHFIQSIACDNTLGTIVALPTADLGLCVAISVQYRALVTVACGLLALLLAVLPQVLNDSVSIALRWSVAVGLAVHVVFAERARSPFNDKSKTVAVFGSGDARSPANIGDALSQYIVESITCITASGALVAVSADLDLGAARPAHHGAPVTAAILLPAVGRAQSSDELNTTVGIALRWTSAVSPAAYRRGPCRQERQCHHQSQQQSQHTLRHDEVHRS